ADATAREWAASLVEGVSPLAKVELPAVPGAAAAEEPVEAAAAEEPIAEPQSPPLTPQPQAATEPEPPAPVLSTRPAPVRTPRSPRLRSRLIAGAVLALVV